MIDQQSNFDNFFRRMIATSAITPDVSSRHNHILAELTEIIRSSTDLKCVLTLFGSTANLLGNFDSDIDICMTLEGNLTGVGVDCVQALKDVHDVLADCKNVRTMEAILTARVPILKFNYKNFDVDLSMYNQCAIHNSKMLEAYARIDPRVRELVFLVKKYAKACGIADASRGSLSSYAWSLMVIHFLQRTNPPILPVLQDTSGIAKRDRRMIGVHGWNVWFNDDLGSIQMTPYNPINLTQLFKSFLVYYANFNFGLHVVPIRTKDQK